MSALGVPLALFMSATVVVWLFVRLLKGRLDPAEDLPLGICNFTALIAPIQALTDSPLLTAWSICVGGPAGMVSMLSPDVQPQHPVETRVKFWIVHGGLVAQALLYAATEAPTSLPRLLLLITLMLAGVGCAAVVANALLCSNYLFLRAKPVTSSPLDWFGDWPLYLLPMALSACGMILAALLGWSYVWRLSR